MWKENGKNYHHFSTPVANNKMWKSAFLLLYLLFLNNSILKQLLQAKQVSTQGMEAAQLPDIKI